MMFRDDLLIVDHELENRRLRLRADKERDICLTCLGTGTIGYVARTGPYKSPGVCSPCHGEGWIAVAGLSKADWTIREATWRGLTQSVLGGPCRSCGGSGALFAEGSSRLDPRFVPCTSCESTGRRALG
ncbi:hypothetical protein [Longispora albida]|uniref:hypothetical protein n=1 Tax=Longispora albida TaxID=203523 RepID=UPI000368EF89|nr:hypothetical protein [Longispora albida]